LTRKTHRIAGSVFVTSAALLGFLVFRPLLRVPEPQPTPGEEKAIEVVSARGPAVVESELTSEAAPALPVGAPPPAAELRHPHPITPQHERIYRENELTFSLDGAVDVEDASGIRRLLAGYRREFHEDSLVLQQGYEIIADCLEKPGPVTRAVAQRFYDTEIASPIRRHLRRHCLERP
jgi:hypothetical protein